MEGYSSDENNWDEWESDQDGDFFNIPVRDLFSDKMFESPFEFNTYSTSTYNFNLVEMFKTMKLDTYDRVRLVNFLRKNVETVPNPTDLSKLVIDKIDSWKNDDDLLIPVNTEDGLLQFAAMLENGFGNLSDDECDDDEFLEATEQQKLRRENNILKTKVDELTELVHRMTTTVQNMTTSGEINFNSTEEVPEKQENSVPEPETTKEVKKSLIKKVDDSAYFGGYSMREIHEVMLRDKHRTETYRDSMLARSEDLFKGKVVLDVGCGTGILSMFAAKAGAKRVIGIDAADIIDKTREIVKVNQLDHIVTLVKGKVEEISLPADILTVDIIVSEWMGYFLLYESMLPSVFYAREKWMRRENTGISIFEELTKNNKQFTLESIPPTNSVPFAKDALMFPDVARMFISGVETRGLRNVTQDFWSNMYGFDMSCLINHDDAQATCSIDILYDKDECTLTSKHGLVGFDLMTQDSDDLDFKSNVTLEVTKDDTLDAFVVWFDTIFSSAARRSDPEINHKTDFSVINDSSLVLDTSYLTVPTHWKQTVFRLSNIAKVKAGDKIELGLVATRRKDYHRHYDVQITYEIISDSNEVPTEKTPIMNTTWCAPNKKYTQHYSLQ